MLARAKARQLKVSQGKYSLGKSSIVFLYNTCRTADVVSLAKIIDWIVYIFRVFIHPSFEHCPELLDNVIDQNVAEQNNDLCYRHTFCKI